jgi:transposase
MPKPFPEEFRRDVIAVARLNKDSLAQVARDFGISEATVHNWLKKADIEDGVRPGVTKTESVEMREAKKRIRTLEQENEILRRAAAYFAKYTGPK